jgi:steroid 5-alpha reductase family enzyme
MSPGPWLTAAALTLGCMTVLWAISLPLRDSSIADIFWGLGFAAIAWLTVGLARPGAHPRAWLLAALVTAWGVRLSLHLLRRNWGRGEDARYRAWRERAGGSWWWRSYLKVFLLQGAVMWVVAAPMTALAALPAQPRLGWLDAFALAAWVTGFAFETVGDRQLARFKADPSNRGRVMTGGLWRYTRHPNYFGDALAWWGHYLLAAAGGAWWTAFSPALMTFLLVRVSGVAMLESALRETKPGYREYVASTSAFIPRPPRRRS